MRHSIRFLIHFLDEEAQAVFEVLGVDNERLDTDDGRRITPGHAMESAAFVMHEAIARDDLTLIPPALKMIDYSMARGWDDEYGGLLYFVDAEGKPPTRLEWDMKLWWPHAEALYALLLAYHLSRDQKYADWFERMQEWTFQRFPDPDYGGWYGYLRRDGQPVDTAERRHVERVFPYATRPVALLEIAGRYAGLS